MSALLDFLENHHELRVVQARPDELNLNCPFCSDEGFHAFINLDKGLFNCFRCGGMTVKKFLRDAHGVSGLSFQKLMSVDKVDLLLSSNKVSIAEARNKFLYSEKLDQKINWQTLSLPSEFVPLAEKPSSLLGKRAYAYLRSRLKNRCDKIIKEHGMGYCTSGKYKGRVVLPVHRNGKIVYFQARSFFPPKMTPPYLNPSCSRPLFIPWGIDSTAILCEGYFDALAVGKGGVAIFGSSMTEAQFDWLLEYDLKTVIVCLDSDAAGKAGAVKIYKKLSAFVSDIRYVPSLGVKDPGELGYPEAARVIQDKACRVSYRDFAITSSVLHS